MGRPAWKTSHLLDPLNHSRWVCSDLADYKMWTSIILTAQDLKKASDIKHASAFLVQFFGKISSKLICMHDWAWSINTKHSHRPFILIRSWQSQKPKPEDNKRRVGLMRCVAYVRPKTQVNYRTDPSSDKKKKKKTAQASSPNGAAGRNTDRCPITMLMITEPWTNNYIQSFFV